MLLGHYAVALAVKRATPRTSLGTLTAAAQWADLIWPLLLFLGWESVRIDPGNTAFTPLAFDRYPFTHSMVAAVAWGAIFGGVYAWRTGRSRAAVWLGLTVFSHWVLDWVTHRADLQLAPGVALRTGLGLWNSMPGTIAVEVAMWIAGIWIYVRTTRPRDRVGGVGFWAYIALLSAIYLGSAFGPPPPSAQVVAWSAVALWVFPFWAGWIDRHRAVVTAETPAIRTARVQ